MDHTHSTHDWLGGFAERLIQIRPAMSIGLAVRCAVMSIHAARELDPKIAAEIFVLTNPVAAALGVRRGSGEKRAATHPALRRSQRIEAGDRVGAARG